MVIEKKVLAEMHFPYAITVYGDDWDKRVICATQDKDGALCFHAEEGDIIDSPWDSPGGAMTVWNLPGTDEFLSTQEFYRGFHAEKSHIVHLKRNNKGEYSSSKCCDLPFLHRFSVVEIEDERWLVAATLCGTKKNREDWSSPGKVYIGKLSDNLDEPIELHPIIDSLSKNHGFYIGKHDGQSQVVVVTGKEGAFQIVPPEKKNSNWKIEQLLATEISDICIFDIDGDGVNELITIEGFHGDRMNIYHETPDGKYVIIYSYPIAWGHSLWCGKIFGKPTVLIGYLQANKALVMLQPKVIGSEFSMDMLVIDELEGPNNIVIWDNGNTFRIYAACASHKIIMYTLSPE